MTMSISAAPCSTANAASTAFALPTIAPRGNPTTAHATVSVPDSTLATVEIQEPLTQTDAVPNRRPSSAMATTSASVASALSSVWSTSRTNSASVRVTR